MAISSPHDVVNNPQSMEAQPVDITGNNDTTAAPLGATENSLSLDSNPNPESFPQPKLNGILNQQTENHTPEQVTRTNVDSLDTSDVSHVDNAPDTAPIPEDTPDHEASEIGSVRSAGFEGSLGSDNEANKTGASNGKDAIPKYTAKKPAGFKPVSVTKSFLAKAGAPVLPLKTAGDKGVSSPGSPAPGSATSLTRPRLIAKTLSSSRSAVPKSLSSSSKQAGSDGPDPNQVWNRNRVQMAPQATPKHMTDEELRQQYGIQLASRPLEGGDNNQAKWADLEDEDEDWAPETLEWSDGTKINLAAAEPTTPANIATDSPSVQQTNAHPNAENAPSTPRTSLGPKATVLKLGGGVVNSKPASITPGSSLAPKSSNEKPTLVAKPSPAPPAKSPWAQLPPVEKASPIMTPTQTSVSRFPHREGFNRDTMPPHASQPAREIAADDYSRFPANGNSRELFNSQSGRYEPAPTSRRLSMKREAGFRAPSLLQRPSQNDVQAGGDQMSMHQQNKNAYDPAAWKHRRTSSNVSNDSGSFVRRTSISRPLGEGLGPREFVQDQSIASSYGPMASENRVSSPAVSHGFSAASQQSPLVEHATMVNRLDHNIVNQSPGTPATPGNLDAEVSRQKKLMRERAEAAMKRRKEEEEKEEAEKRERLRLKLQALEPKTKEPIEPIHQQSAHSEAKEPQRPVEDKPKSASPPKPPVPALGGEPQQYGLMKLHGNNQPNSTITADGRVAQSSPPQGLASRLDVNRSQEPNLHSRLPVASFTESKLMPKSAPPPVGHQFERENPPSNNHRLPSQASAWGQSVLTSQPTPNVNVWGAPGSQKSLGNGDFQKTVTPIHLPQTVSQQYTQQHLAASQAQPQPIGTPRHSAQHHTNPPQTLLEHQTLPHQFQTDLPMPAAQSRSHLPLPEMSNSSQAPVNLPSGTPLQATGISAWGDFAKNASAYDAQKKAQIAHDAAIIAADRERAGLPINEAPTMHETWTQVTRGDALGNRRPVSTTITHRDFSAGDPVTPALSQGSQMRSRYKDLFDQNEKSVVAFIRPDDPLTPPPEESDHPVFFGGAQKPKVRLPGSMAIDTYDRPVPIVRLPLAEAYIQTNNVRGTAQSPRLPLSPLRHQPLVNSSVWQERFNGLLGNNQQLQKRPAEVPEFSMSKEPFEYLQVPRTSVLLPLQDQDLQEMVDTKSFEEESALMEEGRDFGSVPPVRIPSQAPIKAWNPPRPFKDLKRIAQAMLSDEHVHGRAIYSSHDYIRAGDAPFHIKFPLMTKSIQVFPIRSAASTRPKASFQGNRGGKSRNPSGQHGGTHKSKDTPAAGSGPFPNAAHTGVKNANHNTAQRKSSAHGNAANWASAGKRSGPPTTAAAAAVH